MIFRLYPGLVTLVGGCGIYGLVHIPEYLSEREFIRSMGGIPQRGFLDLFSLWDLCIIPILLLSGSLILSKYLTTFRSSIRAFCAGAMAFGSSYFLMFVVNKIRGFFVYPFPFDEKGFLAAYLFGGSGYILVFACLGGVLIMVLSFSKRV